MDEDADEDHPSMKDENMQVSIIRPPRRVVERAGGKDELRSRLSVEKFSSTTSGSETHG